MLCKKKIPVFQWTAQPLYIKSSQGMKLTNASIQ